MIYTYRLKNVFRHKTILITNFLLNIFQNIDYRKRFVLLLACNRLKSFLNNTKRSNLIRSPTSFTWDNHTCSFCVKFHINQRILNHFNKLTFSYNYINKQSFDSTCFTYQVFDIFLRDIRCQKNSIIINKRKKQLEFSSQKDRLLIRVWNNLYSFSVQ